jgi:methionyl-tRNA synthetase
LARRRFEEPEEDGDEYDAERDYDPDDPETYPEGLYADDSRELVTCPHCRAQIDEESEQCPECGMFISDEDAGQPRERKSGTWIVLMVLALLAALAMALG